MICSALKSHVIILDHVVKNDEFKHSKDCSRNCAPNKNELLTLCNFGCHFLKNRHLLCLYASMFTYIVNVHLYGQWVPILSILTYSVNVHLYCQCVTILSILTYSVNVHLYCQWVPILSMLTYIVNVNLYCQC